MKTRKLIGSLLVLLVSIFLILWVVLPLIWMAMLSLKTEADIVAWPPKFIFKPTLENYVAIFSGQKTSHLSFVNVFKNSLIVTAITMLFSLSLSTLAA